MKTSSFLIVLAVCVLSYYSSVYGKNPDIIFPKGENFEVDQEYMPVIGKYNGDIKDLKLMLNNSPVNAVKWEKGNIFTGKIKLNPGLNGLKIVSGGNVRTISIFYAKENKNTQKNYLKIFIHEPVLDNACDDCHTVEESGKYPSVDVKEVVCFNCHNSFEKNKFLHGPIGTGACTACHNPHGSGEDKFLHVSKNKICFMCHEEDLIKTDHLSALKNKNKEECTYCHNPHGGKDKFFLKETK